MNNLIINYYAFYLANIILTCGNIIMTWVIFRRVAMMLRIKQKWKHKRNEKNLFCERYYNFCLDIGTDLTIWRNFWMAPYILRIWIICLSCKMYKMCLTIDLHHRWNFLLVKTSSFMMEKQVSWGDWIMRGICKIIVSLFYSLLLFYA